MRVLTAVCLLAVVLWVGGISFFAFVLAPVAFNRLPNTHEAGLVVGGSLRVLHNIGLSAGVIFAGSTAVRLRLRHGARSKLLSAELVTVLLMFALTAFSQFGILPRMDAAGAAMRTDPQILNRAAAEFQSLHRLSEQLEGTVLLAGLALVVMLAWEHPDPAARTP